MVEHRQRENEKENDAFVFIDEEEEEPPLKEKKVERRDTAKQRRTPDAKAQEMKGDSVNGTPRDTQQKPSDSEPRGLERALRDLRIASRK